MAGIFNKQRSGFGSETKIDQLNLSKTWCEEKNIVNRIEESEPEKLKKIFETFFAEVNNKNW